jgi:hypothetical protein
MGKPINKGRRHELKMLKFRTRLKNYGLSESKANTHAFRSTGKACSCYLCSTSKYKETGLKKKQSKEVKFEMENSFAV